MESKKLFDLDTLSVEEFAQLSNDVVKRVVRCNEKKPRSSVKRKEIN